MFKLFYELSMLGFEAQQAIFLRSLKLMGGGRGTRGEATLMVTEKIKAAQSAAIKLATGTHPTGVVRGYRRKVRANVRRLSKRKRS